MASKNSLKVAAGLALCYTAFLSGTRIGLDLLNELEYGEGCIQKIELEGFADYITFQHCEDGISMLTYWRDSPYTKMYTLIDTNNDYLPGIM